MFKRLFSAIAGLTQTIEFLTVTLGDLNDKLIESFPTEEETVIENSAEGDVPALAHATAKRKTAKK